jgi:hypothetical protein
VTTHNNELAELVFMLKPPGPLIDRANAMVFHALRLCQENFDVRLAAYGMQPVGTKAWGDAIKILRLGAKRASYLKLQRQA